MNYGIPINDAYLRTLEEYKDKPILTAKDRSTVALQLKDAYVSKAVKRLDELRSDYGTGVSTPCRFYNASGDAIKVNFDLSWCGSFYGDSLNQTVQNGQWTTFLHVHPAAEDVGTNSSCGAVIYHTAWDNDIFIGWQNPGENTGSPACYTESKEKDHWWVGGSARFMLHLLSKKAGRWSGAIGYGSKVTVEFGHSMTSSCVAIIEKDELM